MRDCKQHVSGKDSHSDKCGPVLWEATAAQERPLLAGCHCNKKLVFIENEALKIKG